MRSPRPFANPPAALTSVAVLLVAAIVVGVILIRADDRPDAPGPTAAKASAPSINECVLGSWTASRATTKVLIDDDIVEFTSESGVRWQFNADGTGRYDFGSGSTYVELALRDLRLGAETGRTVSVRGKSVEADISLREDRVGYTCSGNSMSLVDEVKEIELRRA